MTLRGPQQNYPNIPSQPQRPVSQPQNRSYQGNIQGGPHSVRPKIQANNKRAVEEIFTPDQLHLFDAGKFSELHFDLQNSLSKFPNNINAQYGLFISAISVGEPERAATFLTKALEMDSSMMPGELLFEIPSGDPEDWMTMAEEVGHSGFCDQAVDICTRIASSNRYEPKIRALATKTTEAIKQDYFTAKERIAIGNGPKQEKDVSGRIRITSTFTFVIAPIIICLIIGCWCYSEFKYTEGLNNLRAGIYKYERIKKGDKNQDKGTRAENYFFKAAESFKKSYKFNPLKTDALYYEAKDYEVLLNLGNYRNRDIYNLDEFSWEKEQFADIKKDYKECSAKIKEKAMDKKTLEQKKKDWKEFYNSSIENPGDVIL